MQALQENQQSTESTEHLQDQLYEIGLKRKHLEALLKDINLEEKEIIEKRDKALAEEILESDKRSTIVSVGDDINIPKLRVVNKFNEAEELKKLEEVERRIGELEEKDNNLIQQSYDDEEWDDEEWDDEDGLSPEIRAESDEINRKIDILREERYKIANYILEKTGKDPFEYENSIKINGLITSCLHYIFTKKRMAEYDEDVLDANDDIYERIQRAVDDHLDECSHINHEFINSIPFIFGLTNKKIDLYTVRDLNVNDAEDRKTIAILIPLLGDKTKEAMEFINTKSKIAKLLPNELVIRMSQIERAMKDFEPIKQAYLEKEVAEVMEMSPEKEALTEELATPGKAGEIVRRQEGEVGQDINKENADDSVVIQ